ncbi:hypothetical protein [Mycobacterium simiae]|uniref:hypothetical protein n=1 Tax=Mycobacterium simiae TaxID=1784 RepID=UPI000677F5BA|nr:hypothetical protein [Mycobacterium simiae]PLV52996.1 hypothetical protein X011_07960 [Mycobacterium tuberculosis variant microti OV254]
MTTPSTAFDDIVAAFHQHPPCEMPGAAGDTCRRPARWRVDLHGCEQVLMCTQHKNTWIGARRADEQAGQPRCTHCGRVFESLDAAVTVVAI